MQIITRNPVAWCAAALFTVAVCDAAPIITEAVGDGPGFAPFSVNNGDLLQTNLLNVVSGGDFTQEGAGGVPILTDGLFFINGGFDDNPQLATCADGSFITFNLNTATNIFGYNISNITTLGGWNDGGRDRQLFSISYSVVGDSSFVAFDSVDHDNASGPGNATAIQAVFPASLSHVDAIRIDFPGGQENGYAGLGEVDVVGSASVPEPGSIALLLGGAGLFGALRRRR